MHRCALHRFVSAFVCGAAAWVAAPAAAQLPSLGIVVSVTAPTPGAPLRGRVTVSARLGDATAQGVSGVQFRVDGVDIGGEDMVAPYATVWDTSAAADGWHTLTAVARHASGVQFTSEPVQVTLANAAAPSLPTVRSEQTDPAVTYSAGWGQRDPDWFGWSGGSAAQSFVPGARATFAFNGTAVSWIGYRSGTGGIARVSVDGVRYPDVDLFAKTDEVGVPVFTATGLVAGAHRLEIEVTGRMNPGSIAPLVLIDAFDVQPAAVARWQETDPALAYTAGWTGSDRSKSWSGSTAAVTSLSGARATLTFNGNSIGWRGYSGPEAGIARVYLDGAFVREVDLYAANQGVQGLVFVADGLVDADHTLTIEATGQRNGAANGAAIVIDAFDIGKPARRVEETDWSVAYGGDWIHANRNRAWSGGTAAESNSPGASATLTFSGTSARWIGLRGHNTGIARVLLDGVWVGEIDTYADSEGPQNTLFSVSGLADTLHTLSIEATGRKNPAANFAWVVVDAFDVQP